MDRVTNYYGALARALDLLQTNQNTMVGIAKLSEAIFGTGTNVSGFTCTATAPASLSVVIGPGQIYELENLEASAISLLQPDTHNIVKQGIMLNADTITLTAPATVGYAQNILIEAQYSDSDTNATVLNYYNAATPTTPLSGPGGNGQAQSTTRAGTVQLQAKYGTAASSGTQITPAPDAGWVGLFVITIAYGQTTVTAGNIATYPGAPFIQPLTNVQTTVAALNTTYRQKLTAPLDIWVDAATGLDSNPGTQASPFQTLQAAGNYVNRSFDLGGFSVTIYCNGAFTAGFANYEPWTGIQGGSVTFSFQSGSSVAANNSSCFLAYNPGSGYNVTTTSGSPVVLSATGSGVDQGSCVVASDYASIAISDLNLGACTQACVTAASYGKVLVNGPLTFSGNAYSALFALNRGTIGFNGVIGVNLSGNPNYTSGFASALQSSSLICLASGVSFSGSATGQRYVTSDVSLIDTGGGGASFFPGNAVGSATNSFNYM